MNESFIDFELFNIPESNKKNVDNTSNVIVILESSEYAQYKDLVTNILKAIGLVVGDKAQIITVEDGQNVNCAQLAHNSTSHILVFGMQPKAIGMNAGFRANYFYPTESFKILLTHKLSQLNSEKKYKAALWQSLQQEFLQS